MNPLVYKTIYNQNSNSWAIVFNQEVVAIKVAANSLCRGPFLQVKADDGNTYTCEQLGCEITDIKANGFSIKFNSQYSISYGTATLFKDNCLVITI